MSEQDNGFFAGEVRNGNQALDLVSGLLRVAESGAVYGAPLVTGERTVVLASELTLSLGAGYGGSVSQKPGAPGEAQSATESGGGGGGGGFAAGRPVAAVVIDAQGVHVEPVVDVTKLGIAFFTTLLAMFLAWSRMRRSLAKARR
jgi:uncharacterized spore protein YtfJ